MPEGDHKVTIGKAGPRGLTGAAGPSHLYDTTIIVTTPSVQTGILAVDAPKGTYALNSTVVFANDVTAPETMSAQLAGGMTVEFGQQPFF